MNAAPAVRGGGPQGVLTVAFCRLGGTAFGVVAEHVAHVTARPSTMAALPRQDGPVEGVMDYLGTPVAVIDLRRWVPWQGGGESADLVLILRVSGRMAGVLIDGVDGVRQRDPAQVRRVHQNDNGKDVFHTVVAAAHASDGATKWLPLLDAVVLTELSALWSASPGGEPDGARAGAEPLPAQAHRARRDTFACLRLGSATLGVPVARLIALAPMPPLHTSIGGQSQWVGLLHWRARHVALLQPAVLLGGEHHGPWPLVAIIEHAGRWVGVPVDEALAVQEVDLSCEQAPAAAGYSEALPLRSVVPLGHGQRMLQLDAAALAQQALAASPSGEAEPDRTGTAARLNDEAYVVFRAGRPWAVPLALLEAIHLIPPGTEWLDAGPGLPVARCDHRGQRVPVWEARADAASRDRRIPAPVLFLNIGGQLRGVLVDELSQLVPRHCADITRVRLPPGVPVDVLTTRGPGPQSSIQVFDPARWFAASSDMPDAPAAAGVARAP